VVWFVVALQVQTLAEVHAGAAKPCRIEELQIVRVDFRRISTSQRVAAQLHGKCASGFQLRNGIGELAKVGIITKVPIDRLQARRTAASPTWVGLDPKRPR